MGDGLISPTCLNTGLHISPQNLPVPFSNIFVNPFSHLNLIVVTLVEAIVPFVPDTVDVRVAVSWQKPHGEGVGEGLTCST